MAENTEKLNLKLPTPSDFYNIEDFNENFQKIDDFAKSGLPKIQTRTYTGSGNGNNVTLTFDFVPKIVFVQKKAGYYHTIALMINGVQSIALFPVIGTSTLDMSIQTVTWNGTSVTFTTNDSDINSSGSIYHCVALG